MPTDQLFIRPRIACLILLATYSLFAEAGVAGRFQFVSGDVKVLALDGKERTALKGQEVSEGETVVTLPEATAQLKMIDGGLIAVRPGSQFKLTTYVFNGVEDGKENVLLSLARGGFRTITGLVGKTNKQLYKVVTPTATVGIRGTDHEPVVVLPPLAGMPSTLPTPTAPPGTYDKVNVGITSLTTEVGTALIARNQVGYAAAPNQLPVILPKLPDIYLQATPAPRASKQEEEKKSDKQAAAGQEPAKQETAEKEAAAAGTTDTVRTKTSADTALLAAAPQMAAAPVVPPPAIPLTATDASGNTLNTADQGTTIVPPIAPPPEVKTYTPGPAVLVTYPRTPPVDAATVNAKLATAQTALASAQTLLASGNSAIGGVQQALEAAKSAVDGGQKAYDMALAAGVSATDPILASALNAVNAGRQALTDGLNAYNGSGTGTAGSNGATVVMSLADKTIKAGSQLIASVQAWVAASTSTTRQDADLGSQSLSNLAMQVSTTGSIAANSAAIAAQHALDAATKAQSAAGAAAASLAALPVSSPNYAALKAASETATGAANAARAAAEAAVASANASLAVNATGNQLSGSLSGVYPLFFTQPRPTEWGPMGGNVTASRDASGQLLGTEEEWGSNGNGTFSLYGGRVKISQAGSTLTDFGQDAATGLAWGRWQGGKVTREIQYPVIGATSYIKNTTDLDKASLHWITGSEAHPGYLSQILTGTATYSVVGGTKPTDSLGNVGVLNSARLDVNFTNQTVNAGADFTVASNRWVLQGNGLPLYGDSFYGYGCTGCTGTGAETLSTFTRNGTQVQASTTGFSPNANLAGSLLGNGLNGAALMYSVLDPTTTTRVDSITGLSFNIYEHNIIQGVVGFAGTAQNQATPYRVVGIEDGYAGFVGKNAYEYINMPDIPGSIDSGVAPVDRVVDSAAGLTEFVGSALSYTPANGTAATQYAGVSATIKIGTALNRDVGSTMVDSTTKINWGRWENGVVDIYSRDGLTKLGTIDNTNRSTHWVTSSTFSDRFVALPLTGSATYTLAGNTNPTDFKGNLGTLGSAKLDADFGKMLVNASVAVSFNASSNTSSWNMSAGNVPIVKGGGFESVGATVTCTGNSCGTQTYGAVSGAFIGNGAPGAVLAYRMATGATAPATSTTPGMFTATNGVVGLAVFKK